MDAGIRWFDVSNWLGGPNAVAPITRRAIAAYGFGGSASSLDRQSRHGSVIRQLMRRIRATTIGRVLLCGRTWLSGGSCGDSSVFIECSMQTIPVYFNAHLCQHSARIRSIRVDRET